MMDIMTTQQAYELESAVIGSVLMESTLIDELAYKLKPEDFYTETYQMLWRGIVHLYQREEPVDILSLTYNLQRYHRLEEIGGVSALTYLSELSMSIPTTANVHFYVDKIKAKSLRRQAIAAAEKIRHLANDPDIEDDTEFLNALEETAFKIRPDDTLGGMRSLGESRKEYFNYLQEEEDTILTGFKKFDEWMGGIGRGWLYILAGRPSVGKTAKMLQMSVGIAKQQAGDVLIWSQEMNRNQLISRMVATESGVSANLIRKKKLDQASLVKIEAAYDRLNDLPLHVQDSSGVNIEEVRATARQMKRRSGKISAIIVDYLTIMDIPHQKGETRSQAVGKVTRKAKQIAREMDCPFIMLAQMSREGIKVGRPKLEHLRDSGEIEQDADVVEFLWHHEDIQKESGIPISQGKVVESIIAKGRDVGTNEFQYVFKGWRQIYDELERYNLKKIK